MIDKTKYELPKPLDAPAEEIFGFAESIADILKLTPECDLVDVVKNLGGNIEVLSLDRNRKKASITVKHGSFTIRLNPFLSPLQKRMSIAHELGHWFLHSNLGKEAIEACHSMEAENRVAENEAHLFAYGLLIPTKKLKEFVAKFGDDSTRVAAHFLVPEPIARQRILSLT